MPFTPKGFKNLMAGFLKVPEELWLTPQGGREGQGF